MGRRLNVWERTSRRSDKERERQQNANQAERRRRDKAQARAREKERELQKAAQRRQQEAENRARAKQAVADAAEAEFQDWQEAEQRIERIATPRMGVKDVRARLTRALARKAFEPKPFGFPKMDPIAPYNLMEPAGPLAHVVQRFLDDVKKRVAADRQANPGPGRILLVAGWASVGLAVLVTIASFTSSGTGFASFFGLRGWAALIVGGLGMVKVSPWFDRRHLGQAWLRALTAVDPDASLVYEAESSRMKSEYEARRAAAQVAFEAAEKQRGVAFEKGEDVRIAMLIGLLADNLPTIQHTLQRFLDSVETTLPVSSEITGRATSSQSIDLAFMISDVDELPSQIAKLTKGGVTYRDKSESALDAQYRLVVNGIALRCAAEVLSFYPSVKNVRVDGYEVRRDDTTGKDYLQCILNFETTRAEIEKVESWEHINPIAVLDSHGAGSTWKKGEFAEQDPVTEIRIETEDDFTPEPVT